MEIIRKTEGLTAADLYALTKGNDVRRMADAKGEVLDISKFVLYKDEDQNGNPMTVLAVETVAGAKYATNSKTFVRNFVDIRAERAKVLYSIDEANTIRKSHENPDIIELYDKFLGKPGSHKSHELLHTSYVKRVVHQKF